MLTRWLPQGQLHKFDFQLVKKYGLVDGYLRLIFVR